MMLIIQGKNTTIIIIILLIYLFGMYLFLWVPANVSFVTNISCVLCEEPLDFHNKLRLEQARQETLRRSWQSIGI